MPAHKKKKLATGMIPVHTTQCLSAYEIASNEIRYDAEDPESLNVTEPLNGGN